MYLSADGRILRFPDAQLAAGDVFHVYRDGSLYGSMTYSGGPQIALDLYHPALTLRVDEQELPGNVHLDTIAVGVSVQALPGGLEHLVERHQPPALREGRLAVLDQCVQPLLRGDQDQMVGAVPQLGRRALQRPDLLRPALRQGDRLFDGQ